MTACHAQGSEAPVQATLASRSSWGVKPPGGAWKILSTDEFKPPPNPGNWKFGDPTQIDSGKTDPGKIKDPLEPNAD
jgi:hypothetical protein